MKLMIFLICLASVGARFLGNPCEPQDFKHSKQFWFRKLNLTTSDDSRFSKFFIRINHESNKRFPPNLDRASSVAHFGQYYSLYGTRQLLPFRNTTQVTQFHFLHGDLATIHTLNPYTGEYRAIELGGHSLQFFITIPSGVYYAVDFDTHTDEKYVLLSSTLVMEEKVVYRYEFGNEDGLVDMFPQHAKTIRDIYDKAEDYPRL